MRRALIVTALSVLVAGGGVVALAPPAATPCPSPTATASSPSAAASPTRTARPAPRVRVVSRPIPYGDKRKAEMAAYAKAHYGVASWRLMPTAIVVHYTASPSASGTIAYFGQDEPNMGVPPGVCAHYVIDRDGTVYGLVPTSVMCRHAIGLNHRAIGIELVQPESAGAERQILARPAQMRALLLLLRDLEDRYRIPVSHIYGHGTANEAPEFRDDLGWRNDHVDMGASTMAEIRRRLARTP